MTEIRLTAPQRRVLTRARELGYYVACLGNEFAICKRLVAMGLLRVEDIGVIRSWVRYAPVSA